MGIFDLNGTGLNTEFHTIATRTFPYDKGLRARLLMIASGEKATMQFISKVHWDLGRFIDSCASAFTDDFDAISYSGHTVHHGPSTGNIEEGTFQLGELSILSARSGKTAVCDFRAMDMGYGGLGAPLTAISDYYILKEPGTLAINIGGIGNIAYIGQKNFLGFDTGPGNMLIDLVAMKLFGHDYDKDGVFASKGSVNPEMLGYMLNDTYLRMKPPKNSGREYYNDAYVNNLLLKFKGLGDHDFIRTITRFTAASIHNQAMKFISEPVRRIIVGGGGTRNPLIMADLEELFQARILRFKDIGIDDLYRECLGFGVLANQALHLEPGRMGDFSNLEGEVIGKIIPGRNYKELLHQNILK